ncbi:hypothetical protein HCN44_004539 [Aphidius gifuensis]|uniref:Serendipity locus protein alpha n=1 Tax=Aphidius gifuensis TaxID=684658 RepID=A0A834XZA0_APHGI|nr:serendipity locus protein alpha-like [Aphidius gifuensis]KAF7995067.1 hypothetical protein HCN44_004539 [Aphidius gifuensis]
MSLKTKRMKEILDPIAAQINKLEGILTKNVDNPLELESTKCELLKHLNLLSDKLKIVSNDEAKDYQKTKEDITAMIEDFCCSKKISNGENIKATSASDILDNFTSALQLLEDLECFEIKQQLQDALDYVAEMGEINEIEDFQNIKELGINLLETLTPLQLYGKNLISKLLKDKLTLYICQLCTTFTMLAQLVEEQHNINLPIYNTKKYICQRACWCLKMIINILDIKNPQEAEEDDEENNFVYKMDLALDMISKFSGKKPDEQKILIDDLWIAIEDVFSHAMVIAQVCQPDDFKAITGVSQTIMSEFENLKEQITSSKTDEMLNSLLINTFTDALYRLERKVNISVLSLVMEVFMDPCCSLKKLVQMCGNTLAADKRSKNDLSNAIEMFDQATDKTMLIGLYAISSCGDVNRVNKIKNYLASLESLEGELVPAIVSFYLHPDNKEIRTGVKLLVNQWKIEIKKLHNAINLIIDSSAYCDVVLDSLQIRVAAMNDCLDNHFVISKIQVQEIVQRACTLVTQVTDTVDDIGHDNIEQQTKMTIRELKAAIFEIVAASEKYLNGIVTEPVQLKVIKRCELLISVIKNLQPALIILMNNSHSIKSINEKSQSHAINYCNGSRLNVGSSICKLPFDGKSITYVRTPYTVKNFKPHVSIQRGDSPAKLPVNMSSLIPYIKKGYTLRNERSIMYKTPQKTGNKKQQSTNKNSEFNSRNLSCIRQHLFSRDSIDQHDSLDLSNESFDLTNILEKITGLSSSLNSTIKAPINDPKTYIDLPKKKL